MKKIILMSVMAIGLLIGNLTNVSAQNAIPKKEIPKVEYTCSMHPEVISNNPGKCPKCGMDLVIKEAKVEYTCTMHPEVVSDKPCKCPKCGMELVKKEKTAKKKGMKGCCM